MCACNQGLPLPYALANGTYACTLLCRGLRLKEKERSDKEAGRSLRQWRIHVNMYRCQILAGLTSIISYAAKPYKTDFDSCNTRHAAAPEALVDLSRRGTRLRIAVVKANTQNAPEWFILVRTSCVATLNQQCTSSRSL